MFIISSHPRTGFSAWREINPPMNLKRHIRDIPDFPQPGVLFRDITPLLAHPPALRRAVDGIAERFAGVPYDCIIGIESRGFVFSSALAYSLGVPMIPVRKPGKLPLEVVSEPYQLEYGADALEIHADAVAPGARALIVDDLLATGGTLRAAARLIERAGATVAGVGVVIELADLRGRDALAGYAVESLVIY